MRAIAASMLSIAALAGYLFMRTQGMDGSGWLLVLAFLAALGVLP